MLFHSQRKRSSTRRKLPYLPRVGLYVDFAGYEMMFKHAPLMEAVVELLDKGWPLSQLDNIRKKHLSEIQFPVIRKAKVIETSFRNVP